MSTPKRSERCDVSGFTLVELIIVIVVLGILSVYAIMTSVSPSELSLPSQAEKMASDIRYVQTLAHTTGKRMRLSMSFGLNGSYSIASCDSVSSCGTSVILGVVEKDIDLDGSPPTIDFDTLGRPSATATYTLSYGTVSSKTVSVEPLTGFVTITTTP